MRTLTLVTSGSARSAASDSALICAGIFGSFVAMAICTMTSPPFTRMSFTRPKLTTSRLNPGYLIVASCWRMASVVGMSVNLRKRGDTEAVVTDGRKRGVKGGADDSSVQTVRRRKKSRVQLRP